jgi:hypothetical protein
VTTTTTTTTTVEVDVEEQTVVDVAGALVVVEEGEDHSEHNSQSFNCFITTSL